MFGRGAGSHDWLLGASGAEMLSSGDGRVWFSISWEARAEEERCVWRLVICHVSGECTSAFGVF